ncbi:hypothetical protein HMPREF1546_03954 [Oscillibacter sp. KLE 1745]|nr:hypothetical protein HMPREF1546_03954 [Oscillibacter sp. KLE 1745]
MKRRGLRFPPFFLSAPFGVTRRRRCAKIETRQDCSPAGINLNERGVPHEPKRAG